MADYSQINDYSEKDALATGNPLKLIKGSDIDDELAAISTAVASKFDSTDVATAGEAQAGTSNTKVITPARLTAWGQNAAGLIEDLQALADPNADRLLFWDDSAGAAAFLTAGTGLTISGTTISVDESAATVQLIAGAGLTGGGVLSTDRTVNVGAGTGITVNADDIAVDETAVDHDGLLNFVADEHIAHSGVTLTAGVGLTGGGTIAASRTFDLDINGLTEETSLQATVDQIVFYDNSASTHRKVPIDSLVGSALGDGKWYKSTTTALTTTEQTIVYNTADNDSLTRGTFSTVAGTYTATATARILVTATQVIPSLADGEGSYMEIEKDGVAQAYASTRRNTIGDNTDTVVTVINLTAGQVVRVRSGMNAGTGTANSGIAGQSISIVELG